MHFGFYSFFFFLFFFIFSFLHFLLFFYVSCFVFFLCSSIFCFSNFFFSFVFPFFFFFIFVFLVLLLLFPVVRADAKTRKKTSKVLFVTKTISLMCKFDFWGSVDRGLGEALLRVTSLSCVFFSFFLGAENLFYFKPQLLDEFLQHFFQKSIF